MVSDLGFGLSELAADIKAGLKSDCTRVRVCVLEVPLLPMFGHQMREEAEEINDTLREISANGLFEVHGWKALSERGTIMPRWLISQNDVH